MQFYPIIVLVLAFASGAIGGLTYVTGGDGEITRRKLLHTLMRQGCGGLVLALVTFRWVKDSDVMQCLMLGFAMMIGMLGEAGIGQLARIMFLVARKYYGLQQDEDAMADIDREHSGKEEPQYPRRRYDREYRRGPQRSQWGRDNDDLTDEIIWDEPIDESIWDDDGGASGSEME